MISSTSACRRAVSSSSGTVHHVFSRVEVVISAVIPSARPAW